MKKKQIGVLLLIFTFLNVASIALLLTNVTGVTNTEPLLNEPLRLGSSIRDADYGIHEGIVATGKGSAKGKGSSSSETPVIVDTKVWLALDDFNGYYYFTTYDLWSVGDGDTANVWIQRDLSWPDPDPQGRSYPEITGEQVSALLEEFEDWIVPTDEGYFGESNDHYGYSWIPGYVNDLFYNDGIDLGYEYPVPPDYYYSATGENVILVSNVRDDNYYRDFPYYIAGFYSPSFEGYFDRNIINIDSYQWEERVGPDGDRPYLYEGVIAHEFQHLIHDDYFVYPVSDATFMNEACSMFAELLCGYPTAWGDINSFMATPDNSLTEWEDQGGINILADYGASFLWATYLNDYVDGEFLKDYVYSGLTHGAFIEPGMDLLDYNLGIYPAEKDTFEEVFKSWKLANLMRTGYTSIDFDDKEAGDLRVYEVKDKWPTDVFGTDFGNTISILDYDTGISRVSSYGTDYVLLSKLKWQTPSMLTFDGADRAYVPHWIKDGSAWYSTSSAALLALDLFLDVDLTGTSVLSLDTMYEIEEGWDFGFVQIWDDVLEDWVSLENFNTTDEHEGTTEEIQSHFPGLTGDSGGWTTMDFDLTGYSGLSTIRFRYMTDWGYQDPGWWVNNVAIDGTPVSEEDFWLELPPETSFLVTVLRQDFWDGEYYYNLIAEFDVSGDNIFTLDLAEFLVPLDDVRKPDIVLAITPRVGLADYSFSVVPL